MFNVSSWRPDYLGYDDLYLPDDSFTLLIIKWRKYLLLMIKTSFYISKKRNFQPLIYVRQVQIVK